MFSANYCTEPKVQESKRKKKKRHLERDEPMLVDQKGQYKNFRKVEAA